MSKMIIVEGNSNDKDNVRVYMVKGEKGDTGDLNPEDIVDNLNSTATDKALSAKQGKVLKLLTDKKIYYFNNVATMKADTSLENGMVAQTLGYYEINDRGKSLYKIRNKTNDDVIDEMFIIALSDNNLVAELIYDNELNFMQLGAIINDNTYDNSSKLVTAIQKINSLGGGTLFIPSGIYYFSTPIEFSSRIRNIHLLGSGKEESSSGVQFNYTGTGTFFTFYDIWHSVIEHIEFQNNNTANFMLITNGMYKDIIKYCDVINFNCGIDIKTNAYSIIENCSFSTNTLSENCYHIRYGKNKVGVCEFFTIKNCQFAGSGTNSLNGIEIYSSVDFYIEECDFPDLYNGSAILLHSENNENIINTYINKINLIRTKNIEIFADTKAITNTLINNFCYYFTGYSLRPDENGLYFHRSSGISGQVNIQNAELRALNSASNCTFGNINGITGLIQIINDYSNAIINTGDLVLDYVPLRRNTTQGDFSATGTGNNYLSFNITNKSPYTNRMPAVLVEQNSTYTDYYVVRKIIDNSQGALRCRVFYNGNIPNDTTINFKVSIL